MARLFISYRRNDRPGHAGWIANHLAHLPSAPELFFDRDLKPGARWRDRIDAALDGCDAMLVVIGPAWLGAGAPGEPPRLQHDDDMVAYEVSRALQRGIPVFPVRVDGAALPTDEDLPASLRASAGPPPRVGLLDNQDIELRDASFARDLDTLVAALPGQLDAAAPVPPAPPPPLPWWRRRAAAVAAGGLVMAGAAAMLVLQRPAAPPPVGPVPPVRPAAPGFVTLGLRLEPARTEATALGTLLFHPLLPVELNAMLLPRLQGDAALSSDFEVKNAVMPAPGRRYSGVLYRRETEAFVQPDASAARPPVRLAELCFEPVPGATVAEPRARLVCSEADGHCRPARDDGGLVRACAEPPRSALPGWWDALPLASARAQAPAVVPASAPASLSSEAPAAGDWIVPALDALRERAGQPGAPAYSEVALRSDPIALPEAAEADEVSFRLRINGRRVWVNGMPPTAHAQPFRAADGLQLVFGLENLDAQGAQQGAEDLRLELLFLRRKALLATRELALPYIALRDVEGWVPLPGAPWGLRWHIDYRHAPADRYQIIVGSALPPQLAALKGDRAAFDRAHARETPRLVGVLRPPIPGKNPYYALSAGIAQPNGQVRYTFDEAAANSLCRRLLAGRPAQMPRRRDVNDGKDHRPCSDFGGA